MTNTLLLVIIGLMVAPPVLLIAGYILAFLGMGLYTFALGIGFDFRLSVEMGFEGLINGFKTQREYRTECTALRRLRKAGQRCDRINKRYDLRIDVRRTRGLLGVQYRNLKAELKGLTNGSQTN